MKPSKLSRNMLILLNGENVLHLSTVAELVPAGVCVVARRSGWSPSMCIGIEKQVNGNVDYTNLFTGEKAHITPDSSLADDWEYAPC